MAQSFPSEVRTRILALPLWNCSFDGMILIVAQDHTLIPLVRNLGKCHLERVIPMLFQVSNILAQSTKM
jgi:hypothetical protein